MPNIRTEKPDTLPKYLELIEKINNDNQGSLWFRGIGESRYPLLPTLFRSKRKKTPEQLSKLERDLITRFKQRSLPYITRSLTEDWDVLFFYATLWNSNSITGLD
jgi:hypothetical protein